MFPISLDLTRVRIALVGSGEHFEKRLKQLQEHGATQIVQYKDTLPESHEIKQFTVLMVAGLDYQTSAVLSSIAKLQGVLVNVEDKNDLCDFYFMSFVKRGDLTISVSTNGASPTLGQEIRNYIAGKFCEEWEWIVSRIGRDRLKWKQQGMDGKAIADKTREIIKAEQWLAI